MKKIITEATIYLTFVTLLMTIIAGVYKLGALSKTTDSKFSKIESQIENLSNNVTKLSAKVDSNKEMALTTKIKLEGVKSQTTTLGKELKVDVETPFQNVVSDAEKISRTNRAAITDKNIVTAPPNQVSLNDFLFKSKGGIKKGNELTCSILVINLLDEDRAISLINKEGSLYDNNDDVYPSKRVLFHGRFHRTFPIKVNVPSKSQSNLVYTFDSIPKDRVPLSIGFVMDEGGKFNDVLQTQLIK